MEEDKICPFCKSTMRPLDNHCVKIVADSPNEKKFQIVTCVLTRYYFVEPTEQK